MFSHIWQQALTAAAQLGLVLHLDSQSSGFPGFRDDCVDPPSFLLLLILEADTAIL